MSKTNFKCMFLIDDKLYNKAILREGANEKINIKTSIPNSTYLTPIPSSRQLTAGSLTENMNTPARLNLSHELREINDLGKVDNGQQTKSDLSDKIQQTEIPFASSSLANTDPLKKSGNSAEMEIDQSTDEKDGCECYEKFPKASTSYKRQPRDVKRRSAQSNRKLTKLKPLKVQVERETCDEDDNLSDDSDWEELRQRYRRLRGDFDSPPRGKNNFDQMCEKGKVDNNIKSNKPPSPLDKKRYGSITKFGTVSYLCSICKEKFNKRNALHRHIMNWHSEYFEEPGLRNKRKRTNEDIDNSKKFRSDGRKKRSMPQNQARQKILRTEFQCIPCKRFYKTQNALERHNTRIHGVVRGSKRANNGSESQYVKRQKVDSNPAVTYLNYF